MGFMTPLLPWINSNCKYSFDTKKARFDTKMHGMTQIYMFSQQIARLNINALTSMHHMALLFSNISSTSPPPPPPPSLGNYLSTRLWYFAFKNLYRNGKLITMIGIQHAARGSTMHSTRIFVIRVSNNTAPLSVAPPWVRTAPHI